MKSIGLIVTCYYKDPVPAWVDLFFHTCRCNPTIQFVVLTENPAAKRWAAPNITIHTMTIAEVRHRASQRLGMEVALDSAYKLVDFRPAFGVIFEDLLSSFDFFGYCDVDLIFGDIRAFLDEETLSRHDIFFSRREFPTGHFSLYRRGLERVYERSKDVHRIFTTPTRYAFDECGMGLHRRLLKGAPFSYIAADSRIDSLMHVLSRSSDIRVSYRTMCHEYLPEIGRARVLLQNVHWARGELRDAKTNRELMYYHLQCLKDFPSFYVPRWESSPESFSLNRLGAFWRGPQTRAQHWTTLLGRPWQFIMGWGCIAQRLIVNHVRREPTPSGSSI